MILGTGVPVYRVFVIALAVVVYFAVQYFLNKTIWGQPSGRELTMRRK